MIPLPTHCSNPLIKSSPTHHSAVLATPPPTQAQLFATSACRSPIVHLCLHLFRMGDVETSRKKRKLTTKQGVVIGVATVAGLGLLTKLFSFLRRDKQPKNLSEADLETLEAVLSGDAASSQLSPQAQILHTTPKFANLEADDDEEEEEEEAVHQLSKDVTVSETDASKNLDIPHFNGDLHSNGDAVEDAPTEPHLDSTEPPSQIEEELIKVAEKLPTEELEKLPAEAIEKLPIGNVEKAPEDHVEANGNSVQAHIENVAEKLATDEPEQKLAEPQPSERDAEELVINHAEVASENDAEELEINHAEVKPQSKEDDAEVKLQSREVDAANDAEVASEHDAEELAEVKPQPSEDDAEELVINHAEEKPHDSEVKEQSREDEAEHVESSAYKIVSAEEPEILTKAGKVSVEDAGKHESEEASDDVAKAQL